jgi:dolichol-phosphate mannosyltransferase
MKVLIILPTYNERENIREIIEAIFAVNPQYHILVVDDNSPDKTATIVKRLQRKNRKIKLIERDFKEGIGPAYLVGFNFGLKHKYDYIVQMDADLSHDPSLIPGMLALALGKNWIIGSRYVRGGSIQGWERKRVLISWLGNWYTKLILGFAIKDWTAGFNLWPREILAKIKLEADEFPNGYGFQIALKYKALKKGFQPIEVPINFRDRRRGKTKIGQGIINEAAVTVLRLKLTQNHP